MRLLGLLIARPSKFEEAFLHSLDSLELSHLAKYAFLLFSKKVNAYYHKSPILAEADSAVKNVRILGLHLCSRDILVRTLST